MSNSLKDDIYCQRVDTIRGMIFLRSIDIKE